MPTLVKRAGGGSCGRLPGIIALIALIFSTVVPTAAVASARSEPVVAFVKAEKTTANAASSTCPVTAYGYTGYTYCDFVYSTLDWGGGNVEWFVIGTDYAMWHAWKGSGGWHSLGGQASRSTPNGAYAYAHGVSTYGTDRRLWCRDHPWTKGWRVCDGQPAQERTTAKERSE